MARSSRLKLMISSRCDDTFPVGATGRPLSELRRQLKGEIEGETLFGKELFEVWINEEAPPHAGTWDSWDVCLRAVNDCDILVAISNGNAGWAEDGGDIGICHAELMTGLSRSAGKVRLIALPNIPVTKSVEGRRNKRFQDYIAKRSLFRGGTVGTIDALRNRVKEAIVDALVNLAESGVVESNRSRFDSGEALDWSHLDFRGRYGEMKRVLKDALCQRAGSSREGEDVIVRLGGSDVLIVPNAIPAALGVAQAKEMVGQPFLRDHELINSLKGGRGGPVHLIACHRTATETQAMRLLGFPDATVVSPPFGVFVADNIQKVQFAFIANCRDESNTRHGTQRFFKWLSETGEEALVAARAVARARIVQAIARENGD